MACRTQAVFCCHCVRFALQMWVPVPAYIPSQIFNSLELSNSGLPGGQIETWLKKMHFLLQGVDALKLLQVLVLSCNELQRMEGLSGLTNLQHLDLAFNAIKRIEGIRVSCHLLHFVSKEL